MNALLKKAEQVGISEKDAKSTIGGLLSFLKTKLPEDQYQMICDKVPGAADLVQDTETARAQGATGGGSEESGGGGLMGMANSFMTKIQNDGGSVNSVPELLTFLKASGVDEKEIMKYLPEIAKVLKQKTGVDISSMIPGMAASGGNDDAAN